MIEKARVTRWGCVAILLVVVVALGLAGFLVRRVIPKALTREDFLQISFRAARIVEEENLSLVTREDVLALVPRAAVAYGREDGAVRDRWGYEVTVDAVAKDGYWYLCFDSPGPDGQWKTDDDVSYEDDVGAVSPATSPTAPRESAYEDMFGQMR